MSLILAMLLTVSQAPSPVPGKAADNPASASRPAKSQPESKQTPSSPTPTTSEAITAEKDQESSKDVSKDDAEKSIRVSELPPVPITRDWVDHITWVSTFLLVIAGFLAIWVARRTLDTIEKQAKIMQRQTEAAEIAATAASVVSLK